MLKLRFHFGLFVSCLAFLMVKGLNAQANSSTQVRSVPDTPLSVKLPSGWRIEPASASSPPRIVQDAEPHYSLGVIYSATRVSCARRMTDFQLAAQKARAQNPSMLSAKLQPRPEFIPPQYGPIVFAMGPGVGTCLDLGTHTLGVTIDSSRSNEHDFSVITPVLEALAEAAIPHADFVCGHGVAKFPNLEVSIPIDSGKWVVAQQPAIGGRPRDTLVRLDSTIPLELSFAEFAPIAQECRTLYTDSTLKSDQRELVRSPAYVGGKWYQAAWEQRPLNLLQSYVCREISPRLFLVAQISYGKSGVPQQDVPIIRDLLDRVADAVEHGPHVWRAAGETILDLASPDSAILPNPIGGIPIVIPEEKRPPGVIGGIISSTPVTVPVGSPQRVRVSLGVSQGLLMKKVSPAYPPLARQARIQGMVMLQAEISKDGTVETLRVISGHPMLAPAAIEAVKQWVYRPYILNNAPVAVETQVQVNFTLSSDPGEAPPPANPSSSQGNRTPQ
jgi:TonB family protein